MSEKIIKKLSVDEHYVRPQNAWRQMKAAQSIGRTVYIYGITGMGKTSFVGDFLARKRYRYYSMADSGTDEIGKAVSESLDKIEKTGKTEKMIVVIDDIHLLDTQERRNSFLELVSELSGRRDVWLILISRAFVPKWLKIVYIEQIFVIIGENELQLSENEQEEYLSGWELSPTENTMQKIREFGFGHPLFLRILVMRMKNISQAELAADRSVAEFLAMEEAGEDLWDYLDIHVYDQWDIELQEFLEAVCIVEQFDLNLAQYITKKKNAGKFVQQAMEIGNFLTEKSEAGTNVYEMRIPMRLSMRRRIVRKYSQEYICELYSSAGNYYEIEGNIPEALKMYEKCQNKEGISRILIENSRRNPAMGDYFELRNYYMKLSQKKIKESVELMAGMSMLQSLLMNEEESERWYQELSAYAKENNGSAKREAENKLLYLDISLPHRGTVKMTDILKRAGSLLMTGKAALPELSVTSNLPSMMNGGKDFCEWSRKDRELAATIGKVIVFVLGKYGKGLINLALAESFFEKGEDNYEVASLAGNGRMQAECGGKIEQVFVAVGILTKLSILIIWRMREICWKVFCRLQRKKHQSFCQISGQCLYEWTYMQERSMRHINGLAGYRMKMHSFVYWTAISISLRCVCIWHPAKKKRHCFCWRNLSFMQKSIIVPI